MTAKYSLDVYIVSTVRAIKKEMRNVHARRTSK